MAYMRIEKRKDIAFLWMDQPGESVNKLSPAILGEFRDMLDAAAADDEISAVVLISAKPDTFIAGADLDVFLRMRTPGEAASLSREGHVLLDKIEQSPKPVVAAIHGAVLGGGLEVALACQYRLATDDPKTVLGQPEVRLGLLPAGGGTQRLPRLVGLPVALDIMLTGRNIYPRQALKMGLIDALVHPYALQHAAFLAARKLARHPGKRQQRRRRPVSARLLENTPPGRRFIFRRARQKVQQQTRGNYPAPEKIIACVEAGLEKGSAAGYAAEARLFDELMLSPQAKQLIRLFFAANARKKNPQAKHALPVRRIGVIGAGLMGAGIASVSVQAGLDVALKDRDLASLGHGEKTVWAELERKTRRSILTPFERDRIISRLSGADSYAAFRKADLIIEAVFEDLPLKHEILQAVEAETRDDCIFASNTSSLPITEIAAKSARPENVIGMHYFSPVPKMPLLEIIRAKKTANSAVATAVEVGIRQGKTAIVVADGPGFYTTRILAPMLNEALLLLAEGADMRAVDDAMQKFGFPVGPLTLMDEVGIDVAAHVTEVMRNLFVTRGMQANEFARRIADDGFLGRKNGKGFYLYAGSGDGRRRGHRKKEVNLEVYRFFGGPGRRPFAREDIQTRLSLMLVNEAALCLQENIISTPADGDLGAILGLGFPPFTGGPFRYMDTVGPAEMLAMLESHAARHGARFTPAGILQDMQKQQKTFHAAD